jgi:hypothetical protein
MVHRVLTSELLFSEIQPDSSEINDIATRVNETIEAILALLEISTFTWCHKFSFKGSPGIAAAPQTVSSLNPLEGLITTTQCVEEGLRREIPFYFLTWGFA